MSRSALVTGVTGYVGGRLAERLAADGWLVNGLVRASSDTTDVGPGVRLHVHDGSLGGLGTIVAAVTPDIVFHLASLYLADHRPDQLGALVESNVLFPAQLAEVLTGAETGAARLVNVGTASQHVGGAAYNPASLYAATKQACVDLLRFYHRARSLSVITLKLFDTYGAADKRRKLIQLLVDAATSGEPLDMSPGEQVLDLTHVDDVVDALLIAGERLFAADRPIEEEFFVSGERFSVRELKAVVEAGTGRKVDARFGARPYRSREIMAPVSLSAEAHLPNWRARRRLSEAVPGLVRILP